MQLTRVISFVIWGVLLVGCAGSPSITGAYPYQVREIGTTVLLEPAPTLTARAIGGAILGTGIAAGLQSKPIPLKPGTDYACKYAQIAPTLESCHQGTVNREAKQ